MEPMNQILSEQDNLYRILLYLYRHQTGDEQATHSTQEDNGVGFNGIDAPFLSSLAEWLLEKGFLTEKQMLSARLRLAKYHGQLESERWKEVDLTFIQRKDNGWNRSLVSTSVKKDLKLNYDGDLTLTSDGQGLVFTPHVFPSKQIKDLGFSQWDGKSWSQYHKRVHKQLVNDVLKMFPTTKVDPNVTVAIADPIVELPEYVKNHEMLFPFQKETIEFALGRKHALIGLAPGLGKTACAIFAAQAAKCQRILVIAPLSLVYNWRREIVKWVGEDSVIWYKKTLPIKSKWTITNYDTLRIHPEQFRQKWDAIIVDESICVKNRHTVRYKRVMELVQSLRVPYIWLLSGAPISRYYDDLWSQLHILDAGRFSSYWKFAEKYCYVENNGWGTVIIGNRGVDIQADLSDVYFFRNQDDVLDLPDWIFDDVHIPMSEKQDKLYGQMEEQFLVDLPDGQSVLSPNVLSQIMRLVEIASNPVLIGGEDTSPKWDAVEDLLSFEALPAIVWTTFIETADRLKEKLEAKGYAVEKLNGSIKEQDRQAIVDRFQSGNLHVLIAHPAVGKFGHTLTRARTAIYLERSYNGDDYYQSLHRIRRIGTTRSPHVIHLMSDRANDKGDTIDWVIGQVLSSRKESVIKLTGANIRKLFEERK